jgi:hypothetical protein
MRQKDCRFKASLSNIVRPQEKKDSKRGGKGKGKKNGEQEQK